MSATNDDRHVQDCLLCGVGQLDFLVAVMGGVSSYLRQLSAAFRGKRAAPAAIVANADGLGIGNAVVPWGQVRRLEAFKRDAYIGDCQCLAILGADGKIVEIREGMTGWAAAGAAIEKHLPGSMSQAEWFVRVLAADFGESVTVFPPAGF